MAEHKPVLSSRVEQSIIDRIDELVRITGVSRADVIERALQVGLRDQEVFVAELEGKVSGPLMELLLNEKFLKVVAAFVGGEVDPSQQRVLKNVRRGARRGKLGGRPATE